MRMYTGGNLPDAACGTENESVSIILEAPVNRTTWKAGKEFPLLSSPFQLIHNHNTGECRGALGAMRVYINYATVEADPGRRYSRGLLWLMYCSLFQRKCYTRRNQAGSISRRGCFLSDQLPGVYLVRAHVTQKGEFYLEIWSCAKRTKEKG